MIPALTIALVCSERARKRPDDTTFEDDVLRAVLSVPTRHQFVVYPDSKAVRAIVAEAGAAGRVTYVRSIGRARVHRRVWRRAKRLVRRRGAPRPEVMLNDALAAAGAQCAWLLGHTLLPLDMPYVVTLRGLEHRTQPWLPTAAPRGSWRERDRIVEEVVHRASAIIVGTGRAAQQVREAYGTPAGHVEILPTPTPTYAIDASTLGREPRPSNLPSRYLFYPADFSAARNHVTALRALAAMSSMAAAPALVLAGEDRGVKEHVLREADRLGMRSRVIALGRVPQGELAALYQHAEALLHTSLAGGESLTVLEAMAFGCPVIAANVPGADEQVGDAGTLVEPLDTEGYALALRAHRHEPLVREMLIERGVLRARGWTAPQYAAAALAVFDTQVAPYRALWA